MTGTSVSLSCLVVALACSLSAPGVGQSWTGFRGPRSDNVVQDLKHPRAWSAESNLAWRVVVPGGGWSSPIVVGDQIFVTTAVAEEARKPAGFRSGVMSPTTRGRGAPKPTTKFEYQARCYRLSDGELQWVIPLGANVPEYGVHASNTFATESPATDGKRLFVTFGALGAIAALDFTGKELWRFETGVYPTSNDFGWGSSLIAADGRVFLQTDNQKDSYVVAIDAASGKQLWRKKRPVGTSWASPIVWRNSKRAELITLGPDRVTSYDPASGSVLWSLSGMGGSFSSSPTPSGDRLYFGNAGPGRRGPLVAVEAGMQGERSLRDDDNASVSWVARRAGPGFPSPVVAGDFVYIVGSMGILDCRSVKTGDRVYRQRLPGSSTVVATPWTDGKDLFVLDETGKTFVIRVGGEFELVRTNEIEGLFWSTGSVTGDRLLLRSADSLLCVRASTGKSAARGTQDASAGKKSAKRGDE